MDWLVVSLQTKHAKQRPLGPDAGNGSHALNTILELVVVAIEAASIAGAFMVVVVVRGIDLLGAEISANRLFVVDRRNLLEVGRRNRAHDVYEIFSQARLHTIDRAQLSWRRDEKPSFPPSANRGRGKSFLLRKKSCRENSQSLSLSVLPTPYRLHARTQTFAFKRAK